MVSQVLEAGLLIVSPDGDFDGTVSFFFVLIPPKNKYLFKSGIKVMDKPSSGFGFFPTCSK